MMKKKNGNVFNKIEQNAIEFFNNYYQNIIKQVDILIDSKYMYTAVNILKEFRVFCENIGKDPRFRKMNQFKEFVRSKDRDADQKFQNVKQMYTQKGSLDDKDTANIEKFKPLLNTFYVKIDDYLKQTKLLDEKLDSEKEKEEADVIQNLIKLRDWVKDTFKSEVTPEQQKKIEKFKKNMSEQDKTIVHTPISVNEEINIFNDYAKQIYKQFLTFEKKGWFNSVINYSSQWLIYLEKIGNQRKTPEFEPYRNAIRKWYLKVEDWIKRVKIKYKGAPILHLEKTHLLNEEVKKNISQYKEMRDEYIKEEENKRIINILKSRSLF